MDNQEQVCGTIRQRTANLAVSIKNLGFNSTYFRVKHASLTQKCDCNFHLNIFFDEMYNRWFLKIRNHSTLPINITKIILKLTQGFSLDGGI